MRLRSTSTGEVFYCRTYDFSTMAVATGTSLESVRFDAGSVPYGDYELCVVANGISSHCVSFCHRRPGADCGAGGCGGCGDRSQPCCDPCCKEEPADPQILRLRSELAALRSGLGRYGRQGAAERPARQAKELREVSEADREAAERDAVED